MRTKLEYCGSTDYHTKHNWWGGFLWLKKRVCQGSDVHMGIGLPEDFDPPSAALIPMQIIPAHKHSYRLVYAFHFGPKREDDLAWYCDCRNYFIAERDLWWSNGVNYDVNYDVK